MKRSKIITIEKLSTTLRLLEHAPTKKWESATAKHLAKLVKQDVTKQPEPRTNLGTLFFNLISVRNKHALLKVVGIFAVLGVLTTGVLLLKANTSQRSLTLSADEQREIFAQILANNAATNISSPHTAQSEAATLATKIAAADSSLIAPYPLTPMDYNYRYAKTTYQSGEAAGRCKAFGERTENTINETYEFFDTTGTSSYKNIGRDADGNLIAYSLSNSGSNSSEYTEFRGGQFAVKTTYTFDSAVVDAPEASGELVAPDEPTPATSTEDPAVTDDLITQYFGENAKINSIVSEGGVEYYVVEYSFPIDCTQDLTRILMLENSAPSYTNETVYVNWVDTKNYSIFKSFTYLDSIADANLVSSYTQTGETRQTDFSTVASNFQFEFDVPVRELDTAALSTTPAQEAAQMADYLATLDVNVVLPLQSGLEISGIYAYDPTPAAIPGWDYYTDRTFYPAGARGDALYQEATSYLTDSNDYINSDVTVSAYDPAGDKYLSLTGFASSYADADLLKNNYGEHTVTEQSTLIWTIGGQPVNVAVYTIEMQMNPAALSDTGGRTAELSIAPCENEDCASTQRVALFTTGNTKYLANCSDSLDVANLQFELLRTTNPTEMQTLRERILTVLTAQTSGSGEAEKLN